METKEIANNELKDQKNNQIQKKIQFPNNFIFGASIFSENIEGQSVDISSKSNWDVTFATNKRKFLGTMGPKSFSGMIENVDDYVNEIVSLGIKTIDISLSWSNLYIDEHTINKKVINYYDRLLSKLHEHKIQIILTFVKFDLPSWFTEKGGFLKKENYSYFEKYVQFVINSFGKYFSIAYLFDDPMYMMFKSDFYKKENTGFIARKQEYIDFILNITLCTSKTIEYIKAKNIPIKIGIKHNFIPFCFEGNKNINFNMNSKLYKYNYYVNFMIMDFLIKGESEEFNDINKKFGTTNSLSEEEMMLVNEFNVDFFGLNYRKICFLTNEKNQDPFELFNEFIYFSKDDSTKQLDYAYVREIFQILSLKYKKIPFFFHSYYSSYKDETQLKNYESKRIEDVDRINFLAKLLNELNSCMEEFKQIRCLGFIYDNLFDGWSYFNTFNVKEGLVEVDVIKKTKPFAKSSALWYKRLCANKHYYNFTVKQGISKEVILESKTKLIDFF